MRRTKLGYGGGGSGPVAAGSTTVMLMLAACGGVWCGVECGVVELLFSRMEKQHTTTTLVVAALLVSYFSYCEVYRVLEQLPTVWCFLALHLVQSCCFPPRDHSHGKARPRGSRSIQETDCVPTFLQSSLFTMQALLADMLRKGDCLFCSQGNHLSLN